MTMAQTGQPCSPMGLRDVGPEGTEERAKDDTLRILQRGLKTPEQLQARQGSKCHKKLE